MAEERPLRLGFVTEHTAGHVTFSAALRLAAVDVPGIEAVWHPLPYAARGPLERLPPLSMNWSARASMRARAILERAPQPYDALLFHTQTASLLSAGLMQRVPTVISSDATPKNIDEVAAGYRHRTSPGALEAIKLRVVRRALVAARAHIAWSEWVRRSLIDDYMIDPRRIFVIPPGTSLRLPESSRRSPHPPTRFLFVGADLERKGGHLLMEALASVGEPWDLSVVTQAAVNDRPGVHVHRGVRPNSPELKRHFAEADVFVLPTLADALPHVVLEAMAAGLPVIATRVAAIPEVVEHGVTGLLVAPGDVRSLTDALVRLARDPDERRRMGEHGQQVAFRRYDARANGRQIIELMKRLARSSKTIREFRC
ncbi:MAG: glycosyltransferase family 4 protein [Solirubrobacteraceae bacterium]